MQPRNSDSYPHRQVELDEPTLRELVETGNALAELLKEPLVTEDEIDAAIIQWDHARSNVGEL